MRRGLPFWPMVTTVVAVAAFNILLAALLAAAVSRGRALDLGPVALMGLVVVGIGSTLAAIQGWRGYLRRRHGSRA